MHERRKFGFFLFIQVILFACFFAYSQIVLLKFDRQYKEQQMVTLSILIDQIHKDRPELTKQVVYRLLTEKKPSKQGFQLLKENGLEDIGQLSNLQLIEGSYKKMKEQFIVFYVAFFLFFMISAVGYAYFQKKEIRKMASYLDKILNGNYNLQVKEYNDGDFALLASNICKITTILKEKNEYSKQEKKQLESVLSDISHQLKTPLTSMYVINDLLKNDNIKPDKKKELLSKNHAQLERIEWLVTSLLKMSRLDSGMVEMKPEDVNIHDIIDAVIAPLQIPIELKNQKIILEGNDDMNVFLDPHWTVEALVNILKNAHEHTQELGTLTISWKENPIFTEIILNDNGCGISEQELPHIFERFYKGSSNKESIGIGLNMSKTIVQKQNGYINVTSEEGKGTTFTIKFYKNVI